MMAHAMLHLRKKHRCDLCEEQFGWRNELLHHKLVAHDPSTSPSLWRIPDESSRFCPHCPKNIQFPDSDSLQAHIALCRVRRPFVCDQCGLGFPTRADLGKHKRCHSQLPKSFSCSWCEKKFRLKVGLSNHEKIHENVLKFPCDQCEASFRLKRSLASHLFRHRNLKPYKCGECQKGFLSSSSRDRHQSMHTNPRPFCCADCGKSYKDKNGLMRHVLVHMGIKIKCRCNLCGKVLSGKTQVKQHKNRFHGLNLSRTHLPDGSSSVCPHCPQSRNRFTDSECLKAHIAVCRKQRPFACDGCQLRFRDQSVAAQHRRYVHEGIRFVCDDCGRVFQAKSVLQQHFFKPSKYNQCLKAASKLMQTQ